LSTTVAVLAEKPSVARDIAKVVGASKRGEGYLHGNGYVVTWAVGHLASLAQPHEIRPEWKAWRREWLPMLPKTWPLTIYEKTKEQFAIVREILLSPRVSQVICATDAGREGELIFRYIYEAAGCCKPVSRLWISSLTAEAIRKGLDAARPGRDYDALANAARGRSRADWLVGMNLSRAYTLAYGDELSVGRVQTPTLAMLVDRELTIRRFVPEDYLQVVAVFRPSAGMRAPIEERGFAMRTIFRSLLAWPPTGSRRHRSSSGHERERLRSNPSRRKRSEWRPRFFTTLLNCNVMRTGSGDSVHRKPWMWRRPSMKNTSSSVIHVRTVDIYRKTQL
jgi:DNA topoisomerase-3